MENRLGEQHEYSTLQSNMNDDIPGYNAAATSGGEVNSPLGLARMTSQFSNVLLNSTQKRLDSNDYTSMQRVSTGKYTGKSAVGSPTKIDDVTSELYSQREMEVLRAKISKRITMQHKMDLEKEMMLRRHNPELESSRNMGH